MQNSLSLAAGTFTNGANANNAVTAGSVAESGGTMTWQSGLFTSSGSVGVTGGSFQTTGTAATVTAGALSVGGTGLFAMTNGTVSVAGLAQFNTATTQAITGYLTAGTVVVGATDTMNLVSPVDTLTAGAGGLSVLGTLEGTGTLNLDHLNQANQYRAFQILN